MTFWFLCIVWKGGFKTLITLRMAEILIPVLSNNPALTNPTSQSLNCCSSGENQENQDFPSEDALSSGTATTEQLRIQTVVAPIKATQVSKYDIGVRRVIRHFSPAYVSHESLKVNMVCHLPLSDLLSTKKSFRWFSTTMGTGVVSILLISIPYQAHWLYHLSIIFFVLNTILFFSAFTISVLRYTLYPEIWRVMVRDPTNSLFLATIPMGFATLVNMWIYVCVPAWGSWAVKVAWIGWMVDAILSAGITLSMPILL